MCSALGTPVTLARISERLMFTTWKVIARELNQNTILITPTIMIDDNNLEIGLCACARVAG